MRLKKSIAGKRELNKEEPVPAKGILYSGK